MIAKTSVCEVGHPSTGHWLKHTPDSSNLSVRGQPALRGVDGYDGGVSAGHGTAPLAVMYCHVICAYGKKYLKIHFQPLR